MADKDSLPISSWKNEDIAAMMPALAPLLQDPASMDMEQIKLALDAYMGEQYEKLERIGQSDAYHKFSTQHDAHALADVLDALAVPQGNSKRVFSFMHIASLHYKDQDTFARAGEALLPKITSLSKMLEQVSDNLLVPLAKLDDEKLEELIKSEPRLEAYRSKIEHIRSAPRRLPDNAELENNEEVQKLFVRRLDILDMDKSKDERNEAFAEVLTGLMRQKLKHSKAAGFKTTQDYFAHANAAPREMLDVLEEASDARLIEYGRLMREIKDLQYKKLPPSRDYSFDEAKDIVISAYGQLGPDFEQLARKAFDEGWIRIQNDMNPHTVAIAPSEECPDAHPFVVSHFSGKGNDIKMLGHELGHAISMYLAGKKQNALTTDSSMLVQESFSHFGERLIENELKKRAKDDVELIRIDANSLSNEVEMLATVILMRIEDDIYKKLEQKGAALTFKELNAVYLEHVSKLNKDPGDVTDMPAVWNMLAQTPHYLSVYPTTSVMSWALEEAHQKQPELFEKEYRAVMEAGGQVNVGQLWDKLLGGDPFDHSVMLNNHISDLEDRLREVKDKLKAMPDLPPPKPKSMDELVAEKLRAEEERQKAEALQQNGADTGAVGYFTGMHGKKDLSERVKPSNEKSSKDWVQAVKNAPDDAGHVRH